MALLHAAATRAAPGKASDDPVLVDPGAQRIRTCGLTLVSFRTQEEGWVSDRCGHVYRSHDAGRSWERDRGTERSVFGPPPDLSSRSEPPDPDDDRSDPASSYQHLEFLRWLSPAEGIAGGYIGARIMRTADAGQSWTEVPLPSDQWIYSVALAGDSVWVCGSNGVIARSSDKGRTWEATRSPGGAGQGTRGARWVTRDVGQSSSPDPCATRSPSSSVPAEESGGESPWGNGTVRLYAGQHGFGVLSFQEPGKPERVQPLARPGSGQRVPLIARGSLGDAAYGFSTSHFHFAEDGVTWYVRSELPAPPDRVTFLDDETVILESARGVFRSTVGGDLWEASAQVELDLADVERVRSGGRLPPLDPLACVATSPSAELHVILEVRGCFGGTQSRLELVAREGGSTLTGLLDHGDSSSPLGATAISEAERRRIVEALGSTLARPEVPLGCWSTTNTTARVSWRCAGATVTEGSLVLRGVACGPGMPEGVGAATTAQIRRDPGYSRASGAVEAARAILQGYSAR
jgi:photosystem II stability/assembly factor-like uncharacterized protein